MKCKKLLSLGLALVMALSLAVPAMAEESDAAPEVTPYAVPADVEGKLVVLHTNDTHGADQAESGKSIGDAGVAALKKAFEAAGAEVLLVSAGDATQGAPIVNLSQGAAAIEFMNAAGYDAMVPGNHEFDWGVENFKTVAEKAEFPILAANIINETDNKTLFEDTLVVEKAGLKVGLFGLDTPEAATKTNPEKIKGTKFLAADELYACAEAQVKALKKAKCDLIICLGHLGVDEETAATGNRSVDVVAKVAGIDLFVDGHSHSTTDQIAAVIGNEDGSNVLNGTKIVSTGTKLANVGVVVIDPKTKEMTDELVSAESWTEVDEDVAKVVEAKNAEVDEALSAIMGKTEVLLNGERAPGVRTQETNLGDFAADALLWFARKNAGGDDKVDVALTNGGGIRASIPEGEISMKTMNTVFPFGNTVATIELTGQQLLEALESATYASPTALGAFPQVAGMSFTVNVAMPYINGEPYGTYFRCANPGSRVQNVKVGDEDLDLEKTYVLATNDFTAVGGDTYYPFADVKSTMIDTGIPLDQALSEYTDEVLGGVITAEKYGEPAGRITIYDPIAGYTDVTDGDWFAPAVRLVVNNNVMEGTAEGVFSPAENLTTASVLQILYNMQGNISANKGEELPTVAKEGDPWYTDAVAWATDKGLIAEFTEDSDIVRGDVLDIMEAFCAMNSMDGGTLMVGNEHGDLMLDKTLTRAEMAQVLNNMMLNSKPL